jgi:hypothetical protein
MLRIFGLHRKEVVGGWRRLHNEELHKLCDPPDIIRGIKSRMMRWAGHVARMGQMRNTYRILVGKPKGKTLLGRPRSRWWDNIGIHVTETRWEGLDWMHLAHDRNQWQAVVNTVMDFRV